MAADDSFGILVLDRGLDYVAGTEICPSFASIRTCLVMYTIKRMSRASALALVLMSSACGEAAAPAEKPVEASAGDPVPATPAAIEIVGDFTDVGNWQQLGGGPSPDSLVGGAYSFEPLIGAISRKSFPAKEGDRYAVDYTVNLVSTPTNGKEPTYVVGPMFLDATGSVLSWGKVEAPLTEATRTRRVESVAPAGTVVVHLRISGMWSKEQPSPDGIVSYTAAKLTALPPVN
jgi:hypothetical protein